MRLSPVYAAVLAFAACAPPAVAQDVPIATYKVNLPLTCNNSTPTTKCVTATPVVNPDGSNIGGGGGSSGAVAQGSTTAGQSGSLTQGAVVSGDQAYTNGTTQPLTLTATGRLKVGTSYTTNVAPAAIPSTTLGGALVACQYRATPVTWSDTWTGSLRCGPDGAIAVGGTVPAASTASGNPLAVGCDYNVTAPTYTTGQRVQTQCNARGAFVTAIAGTTNAQAQVGQTADAMAQNNGLFVNATNMVFNGTTLDRMRGDTTGQYVVARGVANLATNQVSVGTTATLIVAARTTAPVRARLMITQSAAGPCYYGPTAGVTATTGSRLTVAGASKTYNYAGALYGICPGAAVTVDFDEEY